MSRKSFQLAAAAVSASFLFMPLAMPAFAAPGGPTTATINQGAPTQLLIHKYEGPTIGGAACASTGQQLDASCLGGKTALSGAQFTVYKVQDLKTNADWKTAQNHMNAGPTHYNPTTTGTVVTTGANGLATFNGTVALYYVVETKTPDGYTGSIPFFVTLPMTDPANTAWDYSVDVYPKNDKVNVPHEAVFDSATVTVGQQLSYQVSAVIPNYGDIVGEPASGVYTGPDGVYDRHDLSSFHVLDTFAPELTAVTVSAVEIFAAGADATTATRTSAMLGSDYVALSSGQTHQVKFTNAGLDLLAKNAGAQVAVTFGAKVGTSPADGTIDNMAHAIPGQKPFPGLQAPASPSTSDQPPTTIPTHVPPTNTVVSKAGNISILKVGATGTGTTRPLAGAEFAVYQADVTGAAPAFTYDCSASALADNPVVTTFITDEKGAGNSAMLGLSTWYNDGVQKQDGGTNQGYLDGGQYATQHGLRNYCLVETKAPEGFQLLAEPVMYTLDKEGTLAMTAKEIVNQADNLGNRLPLTGGQGVAALSVAGLVLIGGGVAYYGVAAHRRRDQA